MKLSTFILASCLIMLMACYRNKKQPDRPAQWQWIYSDKSGGIAIDTTQVDISLRVGDTLFAVRKKDGYMVFKFIDKPSDLDSISIGSEPSGKYTIDFDSTNGYNFPNQLLVHEIKIGPPNCYLVRDEFGKTIISIPADTSYIEFYGKRFWPRKAAKRKTRMLLENIPGEAFLILDDSGRWVQDTIRPKPSPTPDTLSPDYVKSHYQSSYGGGCNANQYKMYTTGGDNFYLFFSNSISIAAKYFSEVATGTRYYPKDKCLYVNLKSDVSSRELQGFVTDLICSGPTPRSIPDSIPKPQYQYGYRSFIPINQLKPTLDTIQMIMDNLGRDMLVSRKDALTELFNQKMALLFRGMVMDSIKIVGGKP